MSTTNLSADVNFMADAPVRTLLAFEDKRRRVNEFLRAAATTIQQSAPLFVALEALDIDITLAADSRSIDIKFAGDGNKLAEVWALLRRAGWGNPSSRPEKGATSYTAFWSHPTYVQIWIAFSATFCQRVQVGTRMVEQPIYETRCGDDDLPALLDKADRHVVTVQQ